MYSTDKGIWKSPIREAVRKNIELIENDLSVSDSNLLDDLRINEHYCEEDCEKMKKCSRKDQAHFFAERIQKYDGQSFGEILNLLTKNKFQHIASALYASYRDFLQKEATISRCPICRIKSDVNIKDIRAKLYGNELLNDKIYHNINCCTTSEGHQAFLWEELFFHMKRLRNRTETIKKFVKCFNQGKYASLFRYLSENQPTDFDCTCNNTKTTLESDHKSTKPKADSTDESNTSDRDSTREPGWFSRAVSSSSTE